MCSSDLICEECSEEYGSYGKWGNVYVMGDDSDAERDRVCDAHAALLLSDVRILQEVRSELRGRTLGCWCRGRRCHAANLAAVANCDDEQFATLLARTRAVNVAPPAPPTPGPAPLVMACE